MFGSGLWLWNAVLVAVSAADPVDVVGAFGAGESRVHFFYVDAAVRHLRMAGFAGGGRVLVVSGVTGETTDALVDTDGGAIVAGTDLRTPVICSGDCGGFRLARCVALVAEGLSLIGTYFYPAGTVGQLRKREQPDGEVHLLAAIIGGQRIWRRGHCGGDVLGRL